MSTIPRYGVGMDGVLDDAGLEAWEAFVFAHAAAVGRIERELAAAGHISLTWYDVLTALSQAPDHRLRLHELAQEVVLSRSGLTRLLDRLENAGLIIREPAPGDRRGTYAVMTPDGNDVLNRTWPAYAAGIARYFSRLLTDAEKATIATTLRRLRAEVISDGGETSGLPGDDSNGQKP
jgi:DNA-binding MarR family transcriptional regulator